MYTNTFSNAPPSPTTTSSLSNGLSACIAWHCGSEAVLSVFGVGGVPSNVIFPEIDAVSAACAAQQTNKLAANSFAVLTDFPPVISETLFAVPHSHVHPNSKHSQPAPRCACAGRRRERRAE